MNTTTGYAEVIAQLLTNDLRSIGAVTYRPRLNGFALLEDGVMFGFVEADGTPYLRACARTAARFHSLSASKHPHMPYWTVPASISADKAKLCQVAYEAADMAHIAFSFDIADEPAAIRATSPLLSVISLTALAA